MQWSVFIFPLLHMSKFSRPTSNIFAIITGKTHVASNLSFVFSREFPIACSRKMDIPSSKHMPHAQLQELIMLIFRMHPSETYVHLIQELVNRVPLVNGMYLVPPELAVLLSPANPYTNTNYFLNIGAPVSYPQIESGTPNSLVPASHAQCHLTDHATNVVGDETDSGHVNITPGAANQLGEATKVLEPPSTSGKNTPMAITRSRSTSYGSPSRNKTPRTRHARTTSYSTETHKPKPTRKARATRNTPAGLSNSATAPIMPATIPAGSGPQDPEKTEDPIPWPHDSTLSAAERARLIKPADYLDYVAFQKAFSVQDPGESYGVRERRAYDKVYASGWAEQDKLVKAVQVMTDGAQGFLGWSG